MAVSETVPIRPALEISHGFLAASFDLSRRPSVEPPGWDNLPESIFARSLRSLGEPAAFIRTTITLIAAMDRARDAVGLWHQALGAHAADRWVFVPREVVARSLTELTDALRTSGVSQRHLPDAAAWRRISESLVDDPESPVAIAITAGRGNAGELMQALTSRTSRGTERFPFLGGPKVGPMWVRMMAFPGGGDINALDVIPVAVDTQVRRVSENLGVTDTIGFALEDARGTIQNAWRARVAVEGAEGPTSLAGTCAGLDPALWYFGRVGCSYCEARGYRIPIASICASCRLPELKTPVNELRSTDHQAPPDAKPVIGLVGCVKTKLPHAAAARDLYVSPLFLARRRAVEPRTTRWFILSAEHGLLRPDQVIDPYDRKLADLPVAMRRAWAARVIEQLRRELGDIGRYRFEVHAGHAYFGFGLVDGLRQAGAQVVIPTEGLTQGRQRQFYSQASVPEASSTPTTAVRRMSPYEAIVGTLERSEHNRLTLNFDQMESVLGISLPRSARKYPAWWFGSAAYRPPWIQAGWRPRPRLREGLVDFIRESAGETHEQA